MTIIPRTWLRAHVVNNELKTFRRRYSNFAQRLGLISAHEHGEVVEPEGSDGVAIRMSDLQDYPFSAMASDRP